MASVRPTDLAALSVITLFAANLAFAVTLVWDGDPMGGDFQDGMNWSPDRIPQNNDFTIVNSVNGTITYSSSTNVLSNSFYTGENVHTVLDIGAGKSHTTTSLFLIGSGGVNQVASSFV